MVVCTRCGKLSERWEEEHSCVPLTNGLPTGKLSRPSHDIMAGLHPDPNDGIPASPDSGNTPMDTPQPTGPTVQQAVTALQDRIAELEQDYALLGAHLTADEATRLKLSAGLRRELSEAHDRIARLDAAVSSYEEAEASYEKAERELADVSERNHKLYDWLRSLNLLPADLRDRPAAAVYREVITHLLSALRAKATPQAASEPAERSAFDASWHPVVEAAAAEWKRNAELRSATCGTWPQVSDWVDGGTLLRTEQRGAWGWPTIHLSAKRIRVYSADGTSVAEWPMPPFQRPVERPRSVPAPTPPRMLAGPMEARQVSWMIGPRE